MATKPPSAALTVRRLAPADAERYRALRLAGLAAFPHAFRSTVEEAQAQPLSWAEKRLSETSNYWFGAFDGAELVGAICLRTQEGIKNRHSASLNALVVDPARQRRGTGAALVAHLIDFARSLGTIRQITLTVTDGNTSAEGLYERFGFRQFGFEPDAFLQDGKYYAKQHRQLLLASPQS